MKSGALNPICMRKRGIRFVCLCICMCVCFLREYTKGIVGGCWLFSRHLTVHSTRNAQFSLHEFKGILSLLLPRPLTHKIDSNGMHIYFNEGHSIDSFN